MKFSFNLVISLCFVFMCLGVYGQRTHRDAPMAGTYRSTMSTSWVTVIPKIDSDPTKSKSSPIRYGVGATSFEGLFGDLVLLSDGKYTLTKDTHGGTWDYDAKKDSVIFTGWLSTFKTQYFRDSSWIVIYTGDVDMGEGKKLNITYTKNLKEKLSPGKN